MGAALRDLVSSIGHLWVSDGTSRALQRHTLVGSDAGPCTAAIDNIPLQMFAHAKGKLQLAANGATPAASFGTSDIGGNGAVVAGWAGAPDLGTRGVAELGNGLDLVNESGGLSATRGLGTIAPPPGRGQRHQLPLDPVQINGVWISPAVPPVPVPKPASLVRMGAGVGGLLLLRRRRAAASIGAAVQA